MILADAAPVTEWITIGCAVAGQAAGFVWWLAKQSAAISALKIEVAEHKNIPERTLTLEHNHAQIIATRATLKEQNDREHESLRKDMHQIRERHHEMANTMQNINVNLEIIKQFINDLKEERKSERSRSE